MNGRDFIAVLEYVKGFKETKKPRERKPKTEIDWDNIDLAEAYLKLDAKMEKIKQAKEKIEKMMKKDEKKDKKGMSMAHLAMVFLVTAPITGPLMLYYWASIFSSIHNMH